MDRHDKQTIAKSMLGILEGSDIGMTDMSPQYLALAQRLLDFLDKVEVQA